MGDYKSAYRLGIRTFYVSCLTVNGNFHSGLQEANSSGVPLKHSYLNFFFHLLRAITDNFDLIYRRVANFRFVD